MGADFICALIPDCKLDENRIKILRNMLEEAFKDTEEDEYGYSKDMIADALENYIDGNLGGREIGEISIRGVRYFITGGMSWGDNPTECFDDINFLDMFYNQLEEWAVEDHNNTRNKS